MRKANLLILIITAVTFQNCKKIIPRELSVSLNAIEVSEYQELFSFEISSNTSWNIETDNNWCLPEILNGKDNASVSVTVETNPDTIQRQTIINITGIDVEPLSFTVTQKKKSYITISSPISQNVWETLQSYRIKWNDNITDNVRIELLSGDISILEIISNTQSDGLYIWSIPENLTPSDNYRIKITSISDNLISVISTAFSIIEGTPNTVIDFDSNIYQTVEISNQVWMAENLKVTHYPDGRIIPHVSDFIEWISLESNNSDDAYCFYNNDVNSEYGALYTWAAAMGDNTLSSNANPSGIQGVCPDGWHLPSKSEWEVLISYLGGVDVAGGKMKEIGTIHWNSPNTGATNISGFTALPSGYRSFYDGSFGSLGTMAYYWTTSDYENSAFAWENFLRYDYENIFDNYNGNKSSGFSVRCVKD